MSEMMHEGAGDGQEPSPDPDLHRPGSGESRSRKRFSIYSDKSWPRMSIACGYRISWPRPPHPAHADASSPVATNVPVKTASDAASGQDLSLLSDYEVV